LQNLTDDELAALATQGLAGQGAIVEAMRRLRESLEKQQKATNVLTAALVVLTVVLGILSLVRH